MVDENCRQAVFNALDALDSQLVVKCEKYKNHYSQWDEGYEAALLLVRSMIHAYKGRLENEI